MKTLVVISESVLVVTVASSMPTCKINKCELGNGTWGEIRKCRVDCSVNYYLSLFAHFQSIISTSLSSDALCQVTVGSVFPLGAEAAQVKPLMEDETAANTITSVGCVVMLTSKECLRVKDL